MGLLVFLVTTCVTPFVFDSRMIDRFGRFAWLALAPAYGMGLLGTAAALALMARFPGESILDYAPRVFGPVAGRAFLVLLGLLLLFGAPINLDFMGQVIHFTELPRMPMIVPTWILAALLGYACWFGPEIVARTAEVLFWPIAFGFLFIFFVPLATAAPVRLLPLSGFPWRAYWTVPVSSSLGVVRGFLCLVVLGGAVRDSGRGMAAPAVLALSVSWVLLALSLALPVLVLGVGFAEQFRYPLVTVTGTVSFRWFPFQRLTLLMGLVWEMVMYVVLGFYLWSGTYVLCGVLGTRRWRWWLIAAAVATGAVAGLSWSQRLVDATVDVWNFGIVAIGVIGPMLLLAAARTRLKPPARAGGGTEHAA